MTFQSPLLLLLLLPVAAVAALGWRRLRPQRRSMLALELRLACAALLVVAMSQPGWSASGGGALRILVDRSASIGADTRAEQATWLRELLDKMPRSRVVDFADEARLAPGPGREPLGSGRTDIERALRLGLGAAPDGRMVLLSDGRQTAGDAAATAAEARARRVPVDVVELGPGGEVDAAVTRLRAPSTVWHGDDVPLQVTVHSTFTGRATLTISEDGAALITRPVKLRRGDNPFLITAHAARAGRHSYRATVDLSGDRSARNDSLAATTRVGPVPRVLFVGQDGPRGASFVALLRERGFSVRTTTPHDLPTLRRGFAGIDAVVLDDLPDGVVGARQLEALAAAVRVDALGMIVLGGPRSLTVDWYADTPLARSLPVAGTGSPRKGSVALELALDRSGSMLNLAGSLPKIDMARAAANAAIDLVSRKRNNLGIVSFDAVARVLLPMQRIGGARGVERAHRAANALSAAGGTNIYEGLRLGLDELGKSPAPVKHLILMTDGVSQPARYETLLRRLRSRRITLTTIALGRDADTKLLRRLAGDVGGRFHFTAKAHDLPVIFAREARRSARPARIVGRIPTALGAAGPAIRNLDGARLPPVNGYVSTRLRPRAAAGVTARRGRLSEPLLAQWQYGVGRVAVWTPGASAAWAGAWVSAKTPLWNDTLRWTLRSRPTPVLQPALLESGALRRIEIDTLQNAAVALDLANLSGRVHPPVGSPERLTFEQVGPSRYQALLPDAGPGTYRVTVRQQGAHERRVETDLAVPYPAEYRPTPSGHALLHQLASDTGGRILRDPAAGAEWERDHVLWWPLTLAALLLFLGGVVASLWTPRAVSAGRTHVGATASTRRPISRA
jgi:Ca-activated chloride channel family protein